MGILIQVIDSIPEFKPGINSLNPASARRLFNELNTDENLNLVITSEDKVSEYVHSTNSIRISLNYLFPEVISHEISHHILSQKNNSKVSELANSPAGPVSTKLMYEAEAEVWKLTQKVGMMILWETRSRLLKFRILKRYKKISQRSKTSTDR